MVREAAQALDFRRPLLASPAVEQAQTWLRERVSFYDQDRYFAPDISAAAALVGSGKLSQLIDVGAVLTTD